MQNKFLNAMLVALCISASNVNAHAEASEKVEKATNKVVSFIKNNPIKLATAVVGVGVLAGADYMLVKHIVDSKMKKKQAEDREAIRKDQSIETINTALKGALNAEKVKSLRAKVLINVEAIKAIKDLTKLNENITPEKKAEFYEAIGTVYGVADKLNDPKVKEDPKVKAAVTLLGDKVVEDIKLVHAEENKKEETKKD